jgi:hypothetical protein
VHPGTHSFMWPRLGSGEGRGEGSGESGSGMVDNDKSEWMLLLACESLKASLVPRKDAVLVFKSTGRLSIIMVEKHKIVCEPNSCDFLSPLGSYVWCLRGGVGWHVWKIRVL